MRYFQDTKKLTAAIGILSAFNFMAGCSNLPPTSTLHRVELSRNMENRQMFADVDDFERRIKILTDKIARAEGTTEDQAFEATGMDRDRFAILPREQVIKVASGGVDPHPIKLEEIENLQKKADGLKIYRVDFKEVREYGSLRFFGTTVTENEGFDMQLTMIFEKDRLANALISGTARVNGKKVQYIWEMAADVAKGAVIGGTAAFGFKALGR